MSMIWGLSTGTWHLPTSSFLIWTTWRLGTLASSLQLVHQVRLHIYQKWFSVCYVFKIVSADLTPPGSGTDSQSCSGASSTSSTCSINSYGNFFYMSPERLVRKRIPKKQIQKVDMFSLGVIFFELCYPLNSDHERHKVHLTITLWKPVTVA